MNRIAKNVLEIVDKEKMKVENKSILGTLYYIHKSLNSDYESETNHHFILGNFDIIETFLFTTCKLNEYDAGYVIDKILKYNYSTSNTTMRGLRYEVFEKKGYSMKEVEDIAKNFDLQEFSANIIYDFLVGKEEEKINKELELGLLIMKEFLHNKEIFDALHFVGEFNKNNNHTTEDYKLLIEKLKTIGLTKRLIESFILYHKEKDKKYLRGINNKKIIKETNTNIDNEKQKKDNSPSKRKLKERLNELYRPDEEENYFDFKNIGEILYLIKALSLPDKRAKFILCDIYRKAIKNENYYIFLTEKVKFMKVHQKELEDIQELKSLDYSKEEDYKSTLNELLLEIYSKLEFDLISSFEYEASRAIIEEKKKRVYKN